MNKKCLWWELLKSWSSKSARPGASLANTRRRASSTTRRRRSTSFLTSPTEKSLNISISSLKRKFLHPNHRKRHNKAVQIVLTKALAQRLLLGRLQSFRTSCTTQTCFLYFFIFDMVISFKLKGSTQELFPQPIYIISSLPILKYQ